MHHYELMRLLVRVADALADDACCGPRTWALRDEIKKVAAEWAAEEAHIIEVTERGSCP